MFLNQSSTCKHSVQSYYCFCCMVNAMQLVLKIIPVSRAPRHPSLLIQKYILIYVNCSYCPLLAFSKNINFEFFSAHRLDFTPASNKSLRDTTHQRNIRVNVATVFRTMAVFYTNCLLNRPCPIPTVLIDKYIISPTRLAHTSCNLMKIVWKSSRLHKMHGKFLNAFTQFCVDSANRFAVGTFVCFIETTLQNCTNEL